MPFGSRIAIDEWLSRFKWVVDDAVGKIAWITWFARFVDATITVVVDAISRVVLAVAKGTIEVHLLAGKEFWRQQLLGHQA